MKVYVVKTVVELTEKQCERLKKLVRQARKKNIQLNFYENMIQKI